jgi:hypothetical protein
LSNLVASDAGPSREDYIPYNESGRQGTELAVVIPEKMGA